MLTVQTWDQPTHLAAPKPAPRQDVTGELELKWVAFAGEATLVRLSLRKRLLDIIGAAVLSIISLPIVVLLALGSAVAFRAWPFFMQVREGQHGHPFRFVKIRSLSKKAPKYADREQLGDVQISRWGNFIRNRHIDELPQLFNVLAGSMSLVGPRPHAVAHNELYRRQINGYMVRHKVRPGITGWAQVHGLRGETDTVEKMEARVRYDLEYLSNWSVVLDVKILLKTLFVVLGQKNAY